MVRLLKDDNQARSTISLLKVTGHDVASISEIDPGASDTRVLSLASETSRILVTFDADFGDLIFQYGELPPPAILYGHLHPLDPIAAANALRLRTGGLLVVCKQDGERRRAFPARSDKHGE